jgi:hypothetical protein
MLENLSCLPRKMAQRFAAIQFGTFRDDHKRLLEKLVNIANKATLG